LFTKETADKLMELFLRGEQTLYGLEGYMQATKAEIARHVVLYAMRTSMILVNVDGDLEVSIAICEKELEAAPEKIVRTPARTTLQS
jgi:hypothetical protein